MPDWRAEIRRRVEPLRLDPARAAAIIEELAAHLDDRFTELLGRGLSPEAAEAAVREEHLLGGQLGPALAGLVPPAPPPAPVLGLTAGPAAGVGADFRYAARALRKNPGLTAIALVTLGLGIGANAAIFSAVNAILLRPPPFERPAELVTFWGTAPEKGLPVVNYPDALYAWYRDRLQSVRPLAMYTTAGFTFTGEGEPERLTGANVTAEFFSVLGIQPRLGREFTADEHVTGRNLVTVISWNLWRRRFAGDTAVLGRSLLLDGIATTVVGVMPPGFNFPDRAELWIPLPINAASTNCWCYDAVGRLAPDRSPDDVALEIDRINVGFWVEREGRPNTPPDPAGPRGTVVRPLARVLTGEVRTPVLVLLGAVGMVLLITCANLATLLLARATARGREIAVRCAMGASPRRIARQLLAESLLLGTGGAALGIAVAWMATGALSRVAAERISYLDGIRLDLRVLGFTLGAGLAAGVLFGLAPAMNGARVDLVAALKEGARGTGSKTSRRLHDVFVAAQLALSVILLVGAGLLLRSFGRLTALDPGFRPDRVVVGRLSIPFATYGDMGQVRLLVQRLEARVRALPGVEEAAVSSTAPFSRGDNQQELLVQGREPGPGEPVPVASIRRVSPGYFDAVRTPLLEGRGFTPADGDSSDRVAIIDASLARRYWPEGGAVGKRIATGNRAQPVWRTVVGVAASIRHRRLDRAPDHYVYYPLAQASSWTLDLVVRSSVPPASLIRSLRAELFAVDPSIPLYDVTTLEAAVERSVSTRRFTNRLLAGFAVSAVLLAAIGIYGVMSRNVATRIREFGVRLALGARPGQLETLVLRQGLRLVAIGALAGVAGAAGLTRFLRGLLYEVTPLDPVTFGGAVLLLAAVALAACWLPARRATGADPLEALRAE